jgi:hypothetical protein
VQGGRHITTSRSRTAIKVRTASHSLIVKYRVNATGGFKTARAAQGRNWTVNARLQSGRNIIEIRTIDPRAGISATIRVVVIRE